MTSVLTQSRDSLELTTEKIHAITDKIPQRPVTVVEGASYSVIILAAFGVRHTHAHTHTHTERA